MKRLCTTVPYSQVKKLELMSKQILRLANRASAFYPTIHIHLIKSVFNLSVQKDIKIHHLVCINFQHNFLSCFFLLIFLSFPQSYVPVFIVSNIVLFSSKGQCEKQTLFLIPFSFVFFRNSLCLHHLFPCSYPFLQEF